MTIEHDLIKRYFAPLCSGPDEAPAFGLLDDTALLRSDGSIHLLITTDSLVADVHFFAEDPPSTIAQKALAMSVSDIIAKGGRPRNYLLNLALPTTLDENWLPVFSKALGMAQEQYGCRLIGGDTVSTPGPLMVSITLTGEISPGTMVRRTGAGAGDVVYVSGTIGDAALGLIVRHGALAKNGVELASEHELHLLDRYLRPRPRLAMAEPIRLFASAAMDISDGLAGDFGKLCTASRLGGLIEVPLVPLSDAATSVLAQAPQLLDTVLAGGDDYEILASIPVAKVEEFEATAPRMTRIGVMGPVEDGIIVIEADGKVLDLAHGAFDHFRTKGKVKES